MTTRIHVLVDDRTAAPGLATEHGLALWLEHGGHTVLFDTGTSGRVLEANAAALGVRLEQAEALCLSHGHYDHTGGLGAVLERLRGVDLFAHPAVFVPKYARRADGWEEIGMRLSREQLEAAGLRLHLSEGPQEVCPGATLLGEVAREPRLVPASSHLYIEHPSGRQVDPFPDDQAIALIGRDGLIVVSGCAHAGIVNHCRAAQEFTGERRLRAVVGGFHLVGCTQALLDATIEAFRELAPEAIHPCHCTGEPAMAALTRAFPHRCAPIAAGAILEW